MRGLRVVWRGLRDTYYHLLPFTMASLMWWLGVGLIVTAPGATLALFRLTDPRISSDLERPGIKESARGAIRHLRRGWLLTLCTLPLLALLIYNLSYYQALESRLAILVPLWALLFLLGVAMTLGAFSLAALFDQAPLTALRNGLILTGAKLPSVIIVVVLIGLVLFVGTFLVVPLIMFLPATVAAIINRLVLDALEVPVFDPLAPTDERLREQQVKQGSSRFGP